MSDEIVREIEARIEQHLTALQNPDHCDGDETHRSMIQTRIYCLESLADFIKSRPSQPVSEPVSENIIANKSLKEKHICHYDGVQPVSELVRYVRDGVADNWGGYGVSVDKAIQLADALSASEAKAERLAKCLSDVTLMDDIGSAIKLAQAALDAKLRG